jgi:hypothetical protein
VASRPKPKPWVTNALTGEKVSPDVDWLIDRLAAINPAANDLPDVIDSHAHQIYGHWVTWRRRGDTTAIEIRGTQRPYAKRVDAKGSIKDELERLLTVARGRSDKRWITGWLGVTSKTLGLIGWRPHGNGGFEITPRGLRAIAPFRADALPLIAAALRKHEAIPAADRQKRQRDALADDVVRAVAVAYRDLTGEPGFVWDDLRGQYRGGLLDLGRDIEAHFGGAGLFAARRLRFISETLDS